MRIIQKIAENKTKSLYVKYVKSPEDVCSRLLIFFLLPNVFSFKEKKKKAEREHVVRLSGDICHGEKRSDQAWVLWLGALPSIMETGW